MRTLRWLRMIGDTVFAVGAVAFVYFALDLILRRTTKIKVRSEVAAETV
jgi:nitric oxide reductase large subunit